MINFLTIISSIVLFGICNSSPLNSYFELSSVFNGILKQSKVPINFGHLVKQDRKKRQISSNGVFCVKECIKSYESGFEKAGLTTGNSKYFPIDRTLFQNNNFEQYCSFSKDYVNCVNSCGEFPRKDMVLTAFKILEYLCIDHYNEFIQFMPCYQSDNQTIEKVCDEKCGDTKYYSGIEKEMLTSPEEKLAKICGFLSCFSECAESEYERECEEKGAGKLISSFTRDSMKQTIEMFKKIGIDSIFPEKCYKMSGTTKNSNS